MVKIDTGSSSKIVDISAGFSHSLFLNGSISINLKIKEHVLVQEKLTGTNSYL